MKVVETTDGRVFYGRNTRELLRAVWAFSFSQERTLRGWMKAVSARSGGKISIRDDGYFFRSACKAGMFRELGQGSKVDPHA